MRDPLALDAGLVIYGGVLAIVVGASIVSDTGALSTPAVVAGVVATLTVAGLATVAGGRVVQWFDTSADTSRERARYVLPLVALVVVRLFVLPLLPPVAFHGLFGVTVAMVAVGGGRAAWRAWDG